MSPWEALEWFQLITETQVSLPQNVVTPVVLGDPMRVVLMMSSNGAGLSTVLLGTKSNITTNVGLTLTVNEPFIFITQQEHGPLCSYPWFATTGSATTLLVQEVRLRAWPEQTPPAQDALIQAIGELSRLIRRLTDAINPGEAPARPQPGQQVGRRY